MTNKELLQHKERESKQLLADIIIHNIKHVLASHVNTKLVNKRIIMFTSFSTIDNKTTATTNFQVHEGWSENEKKYKIYNTLEEAIEHYNNI